MAKKIELPFTSFELVPKTLGYRQVTHEFNNFISNFVKSKQFELYLASDKKWGINLSMALRDFITSKQGYNSNWEYPTFTNLYKETEKFIKLKYEEVK